ncbi:MAG: iron dependent repressor, metal binding and dimerization domain protein [Candidatus Nitrosocaldaceae archaeon]
MKNRLESIKRAHKEKQRVMTSKMEDYLEVILELIEDKGYATVVDISSHLNVSAASVTNMVKRLRDQGYLEYERYRGLRLTEKGKSVAESIRERHGILIKFLTLLCVDEDRANKEAEGLEHYLESSTLIKLEKFIKLIETRPELVKEIKDVINK